MNCFIEALKHDKEFVGIKLGSVQTKIKNFADDTNVFLGNSNDLDLLMEYLASFEKATGLKVNIGKSKLFPIGIEPFKLEKFPFDLEENTQMLGVPIRNGPTAAKDIWEPALKKIENAIVQWKKRNLTLIGKTIIVNSLLLSRLWYRGSIFKIPKKYRGRLKNMIKKFLFNDRPAWTKKKVWYAPKDKGGLGILPIKTQNEALLAKIVYKMTLPAEERPQWCQLADLELGRLGTNSLNGNIKTRMEVGNRYWKDLKDIWNKFVHYEPFNPVTVDQLLETPIAAHKDPGPSTPDLYVGDLFTASGMRCFRCSLATRLTHSVAVSQDTYSNIQAVLQPTMNSFGTGCTCRKLERKRLEPVSKSRWSLNGKLFKFTAKMARLSRQGQKWPRQIFHEHWQNGTVTQYLPLLNRMIKKKVAIENKIKCIRWKMRHNMVPRNHSGTLKCIYCQEKLESMEHIWLDCNYTEAVYVAFGLGNRFGRNYGRIFGTYDSQDNLLGTIQMTIWNHFWKVYHGECQLFRTRKIEQMIKSVLSLKDRNLQ